MFCQRGSNFDIISPLFSYSGAGSKYNYKQPSSARQLHTITLRADDGPTMNAGLAATRFFRESRPALLENPIFCDFSRSGTPVLPLDLPMMDVLRTHYKVLGFSLIFEDVKGLKKLWTGPKFTQQECG